jgi:uncharacterized protein (TIGR02001 family)
VKNFLKAALLCLLLGLTAAPARADEPPALSFEGTFTILSDYSYRGISRTPGVIAGQLSFDLVHIDGWFAGTFISNVRDPFGHDVEAEFYIGYTRSLGAYDLTGRVSYDSFHGGGDSTGYLQFQGTIARDFGLAYLATGFAFTPDNREFGTGRSVYWFSEADIPLPFPHQPPMSIELKAGYENFSGGFDKWDWSVGFYLEKWTLEWGLLYHDTNLKNFPGASGDLLFSVRKYF